MARKHVCGVARLVATLLLITAPGIAWAGGVFSPNNIVVSRSVYVGVPSTVVIGQILPPNCVAATHNVPLLSPPNPAGSTTPVKVTCATAVANGTYPNVFSNDGPDGSFGVTSPIFLDQLTTAGALLNSLAIDSTQIDTSFSSKSELGPEQVAGWPVDYVHGLRWRSGVHNRAKPTRRVQFEHARRD